MIGHTQAIVGRLQTMVQVVVVLVAGEDFIKDPYILGQVMGILEVITRIEIGYLVVVYVKIF